MVDRKVKHEEVSNEQKHTFRCSHILQVLSGVTSALLKRLRAAYINTQTLTSFVSRNFEIATNMVVYSPSTGSSVNRVSSLDCNRDHR